MPQHPPKRIFRRRRRGAQPPTHLFQGAVALFVIARRARGHHVVPTVSASAAARHHMVDRLGRTAAIRATPTVAGEDGSSRQADSTSSRHLHIAMQSHYGGHRDRVSRAAQDPVSGGDRLGFVRQQQDRGTAHWNHAQRLITGVQHQCAGGGHSSGGSLPVRGHRRHLRSARTSLPYSKPNRTCVAWVFTLGARHGRFTSGMG